MEHLIKLYDSISTATPNQRIASLTHESQNFVIGIELRSLRTETK